MRLKDRVAIVVGAGQSPGEGIGNGRATAITFAREGAKVLCVDHNLASAQETVDIVASTGGTAAAFHADATRAAAPGRPISWRWSLTPGDAGAVSTSCTTMSASASPAAMPNCWR